MKTRVCPKYFVNDCRLLHWVTSNHNADYYCMNCLYSSGQKANLRHMKMYATIMIIVTWECLRKIRTTWNIIKVKNIWRLHLLSMHTQNRSLKRNTCNVIQEESSTTKIGKHAACGYSLFTHCPFGSSRSKHNFFRGLDWMRKLYAGLKSIQQK